jgi:hypothetical protein
MKTKLTLDVHDKDISPAIYSLLFSGILVELMGNDMWYEISMESVDNTYWNDAVREGKQWAIDQAEKIKQMWQKILDRGSSNCYHDTKKMEEFIENPCTYQEALNELKTFLIKNGVGEDDEFLVKIWW